MKSRRSSNSHARRQRFLETFLAAKGTAARVVCIAVATALLMSACSGTGSKGSAESSKEVVIVTYDSFALPKSAAKAFKASTGATIKVVASGDTSEMLARALLGAGTPEGDVIFGIDNSLAPRALSVPLLEALDNTTTSAAPAKFVLTGEGARRLVPIDHGEVCLNVDESWFKTKGVAVPQSLNDLTGETYKGLTVLTSPVTSGPGLSFLIGTVAAFGADGWQSYWSALKANDVLVRPSWDDAYYSDYTVSGGTRPIVLSYASSPPAEVVFSEGKRKEPVSVVMTSSCVSQIEYAGVLEGAPHPELARKLVRFMLEEQWQKELPLTNFVYPVTDVELPVEFQKWAPAVKEPLSVSPQEIETNRERWIEQWRRIME